MNYLVLLTLLVLSLLSDCAAASNQKIIELVEQTAKDLLPLNFEKSSTPIKSSSQAIFSCALSETYIARDAISFAGTARKTGFTGDILVAVLPHANKNFIDKLKYFNVSVFTATTKCKGRVDVRCEFQGRTDFPVTLLRNYIYQIWALNYKSHDYLMTADFRDVIFQANPFKYKLANWGPSAFDIALFQEAHPNRVINRTPRVGGFVLNCYGKEVYNKIGTSTISSNGVIFATRDATIIYNYMLTAQEDTRMRQGIHTNSTNAKCLGFGADQAFHNYLLYTHALDKHMMVKVFDQGEGPVNTVGGFFGERKILRAQLSEWKIIRGEAPFKYVHNWNGEISPVVHQIDRFLGTELIGGMDKHLAVFQHMI